MRKNRFGNLNKNAYRTKKGVQGKAINPTPQRSNRYNQLGINLCRKVSKIFIQKFCQRQALITR